MEGPVSYRRGRLFIDGVPASRIARAAGTPVYAYSARELRGRLRAFDRAFAGHGHLVCCAVKANTNRSVCRTLFREGAGADIVSGGELRRALDAGCPPGRIVFSGVGKTEPEMRAALRAGILAFNVESSEEAELLAAAARRMRRPAPFAARLNPDIYGGTHPHVTTGRADTKFGMPRAEALRLYARRGKWLRPVGVQCHIGSQITSAAPYGKALRSLLSVVDVLASRGVRLEHVDVGGGMGIRYEDEGRLSPRALAGVLLPGLRRRGGLRLVLEPGRALVGPAGVLLTSVLYRKRTPRKRFLIVDAGMNDLVCPAFYGSRHTLLPGRKGRAAGRWDVVGPVCETADFLAKGRPLPAMPRGGVLAVLQAGAYGFSMSSEYNSRPRAAEVLVDGRSFRVVRARGTLGGLARGER